LGSVAHISARGASQPQSSAARRLHNRSAARALLLSLLLAC
jgi:hypothetical protein